MIVKKPVSSFTINKRIISHNSPVYFIADIAANHDGSMERAKKLISLAKESGADAVKFQHFKANKIVSDYGFKQLGKQQSHQSNWEKSVFETYELYETNREWTEELISLCNEIEIDFMTTPYDLEAIDYFSSLISAFKIGSGDITWIEAIERMATYQKPVFLATGASSMDDVERAVTSILNINPKILLMQCNTNYTADFQNLKYVNLNVLKSYASKWPGIIIGLSDHTYGHAAVLGAVTMGAKAVEKHFTDDNSRQGPDHLFSMNPQSWKLMVEVTRELEMTLGDGVKRIEDNEQETAILQRRCIRLKYDKMADEYITYEDLEFLRPAPEDSIPPYLVREIVNKKLKYNLKKGDYLRLDHII